MRKLSLLAAAAFAATAVPASATITFGNQTVGQGEEVLLGQGTTGTSVTGTTNQTATSVTFTSGNTAYCSGCFLQTLSEPSNGQARVETMDGSVLRDLIACGRIPLTLLTVIKRQGEGSPIVEAAHAINHGQLRGAVG